MRIKSPSESALEFYADVIGSDPQDVPLQASSILPGLRILGYDTADVGAPWTAVTCGMSSVRMNTPLDAVGCSPRAELISYLPSIAHEYTWWLAWLAELPFIDRTWIGHGHTVYGREPLFPDSYLQHFLFLPPLVRQHREMSSRIQIERDPVELWWVVPITDAERDFKISNGIDALLDLFDEHGLPLVLNPHRNSAA